MFKIIDVPSEKLKQFPEIVSAVGMVSKAAGTKDMGAFPLSALLKVLLDGTDSDRGIVDPEKMDIDEQISLTRVCMLRYGKPSSETMRILKESYWKHMFRYHADEVTRQADGFHINRRNDKNTIWARKKIAEDALLAFENGVSTTEICRAYGVSRQWFYNVRTGKTKLGDGFKYKEIKE